MRISDMALLAFTAAGSAAGMAGGMAAPAVAAETGSSPSAGEDDTSKFFWFNKPGVSIDAARTDIRYCAAQTASIMAPQDPSASGGGLLGALVIGMLKGATQASQTRRMIDAGMRKCLGLYDYARYAVPEAEWNAMMRAPDAIERLAGFAAGPAPTTQRLDP